MCAEGPSVEQRFRIWMLRCPAWPARRWNDAPPTAVVVRPIDAEAMSARDAALFVRAFNLEMLRYDGTLWAVPVPVQLRYEGDLVPGDRVRCERFDYGPLGCAADD